MTDRLALLRGLMDTDGTCKKNGQPYFASVSKQLATDIVEIVQSLGGLATLSVEYPTFQYRGEIREGRPRYVVTPCLPSEYNPFLIERKAARWHRVRSVTRRILSIELADSSDATCITVEAADGLFVTEGHVVTHNCQAVRTKDANLLFVTLKRNALDSHPQASECVLVFRKPGESRVPVIASDVSNQEWIQWAHHVWYSIRATDVLNAALGKDREDEKHICPLQLSLIERCVRLWSNPGETVFSPFAGIGSEGYEALEWGRRFYGVELKRSYFEAACRFLREKEQEVASRLSLFDSANG